MNMEKININIKINLDHKEGENPYQFIKMGIEIPDIDEGPVKDLLIEKAIVKRLKWTIEKD